MTFINRLWEIGIGNVQIKFKFKFQNKFPDSKVHGANMGPTWVLSAPDGPHIGPMNIAVKELKLYSGNPGVYRGMDSRRDSRTARWKRWIQYTSSLTSLGEGIMITTKHNKARTMSTILGMYFMRIQYLWVQQAISTYFCRWGKLCQA